MEELKIFGSRVALAVLTASVSVLRHTPKQDKASVNQQEEIKVSGEPQVCGYRHSGVWNM